MTRARPPHRVRQLSCRECGAPIDVKDERTRMLVCTYCGSSLELEGVEQTVLERHSEPRASVPFRIELGERLLIEGARYEVIARLCIIEPGEVAPAYHTYQYYLYHPRREPRWLSEYEGAFDLTRRTRLRLRADPFDDELWSYETYDGREWEVEERATTEVHYVDGALPYVQQVGDRAEVVELRGATDDTQMFEVSRAGGADEIEYGEGASLSNMEVEAALGRSLAPPILAPTEHRIESRKKAARPYLLAGAGFLVAVLAGLQMLLAPRMESGEEVMWLEAAPESLDGDLLSDPFEVTADDDVLRVTLYSPPLDNAWYYTQVALVDEDGDTVLHVGEAEFGYYHGIDAEGRWSEGSRGADVFVQVEEAGRYRILLGGVSGTGEAPSDRANHYLEARVYRDANYVEVGVNASLGTFMLGVFLLLAAGSLSQAGREIEVVRRRARILVPLAVLLIAGAGAWTAHAIVTDRGVPELEHPDGISIRQSSVPGRVNAPFFFVYNSPRHFLGGGVHGGK